MILDLVTVGVGVGVLDVVVILGMGEEVKYFSPKAPSNASTAMIRVIR